MLVTELFLFMLVIDDELTLFTLNNRDGIGWVCIVSLSLIIVLQMITDIIQQWKMLIKLFNKGRRLLKYLVSKF